ncbi:hypothetical protein HWQ67_14940 [Candidatus Magnetobacterium casensis]|uniref:Kazal-like domain-containing protein n=2 Tax=Candidatus Magnetobacterium casense TaxID=1455061 RepID=A0ABS6S236_9BACT|nr:hypothetical protein [Candidatus Magnetobacterium casensis]
MPLSPLAEYVQNLLNNNYPEQYIRNYLAQTGYQPAQVDAAFTEVQQATQIAPTGKPWLWIAGAVLGLGLGGLIVALLFAAPAAKLTISTLPEVSEALPGDTIDFRAIASAEGTIESTIVSPDGDIIGTPAQKEARQGSQLASVRLPDNAAPGEYEVKVTITDAKGREASSSFSITVQALAATCDDGTKNQGETGIDCGGPCPACPVTTPQPPAGVTPSAEPPAGGAPTEPPAGGAPAGPPENQTPGEAPTECPEGCNDYDPTTKDECVAGKCVNTPTQECGDGTCSGDETSTSCPQDCAEGAEPTTEDKVIEDAKKAAATEPDRAVSLCNSIPTEYSRHNCMQTVAFEADKSALCQNIGAEDRRDSCYAQFAFNKNQFEVCDKITARYLRDSCIGLRNLRMQQKSMEESNKEAQATLQQLMKEAEKTHPPGQIVEAPAPELPEGYKNCQKISQECDSNIALVCGINGRTYLNACRACQDKNVDSYAEGAC